MLSLINGYLDSFPNVFMICLLFFFVQSLFKRKIKPSIFSNLSVLLAVRFLFPFKIHLLWIYLPIKAGQAENNQVFSPVPFSSFSLLDSSHSIVMNHYDGIPWEMIITTMYIFVALCIFIWRIFNYFVFRRTILALSRPTQDSTVINIIREIALSTKTRQQFQIYETTALSSPAIIGLWHPVLLIPRIMIQQWEYDEFGFAIRHEIYHIKRKDMMRKFCFSLVEIIYWPVVSVWLWTHLEKETIELACDENLTVTMDEEDQFRYLECILKIVREGSDQKRNNSLLLFSKSSSYLQLKRRIDQITTASYKQGMQFFISANFIFAMLVSVVGISFSGSEIHVIGFAQNHSTVAIEEMVNKLNRQAHTVLVFSELSFLGSPSSIPGYIAINPQLCSPEQQDVLNNIHSTEDLRKIIQNTFEPKTADYIVKDLLGGSSPLYKDIDGKLCMSTQSGRAYSANQLLGWKLNTISVLDLSSDEIILQMQTSRPNKNLSFDSCLKLVKKDDHWALTQTYFDGAL